MPTMLVCVSHSPIILVRDRAPAEEPQILELYESCRRAVSQFDPELIVIFGCDHFAGFFLATMPAYCIGLAEAEAVPDVGGFAGKLRVPPDIARELLLAIRAAGFDPAISYQMTLDHGFSQPLHRLTGGLDRYPTVPIFIGSLAPPLLPFARSRAFGAAVGEWLLRSSRRALIIGSGGLSHHPTRYFPLLGEGVAPVAAWQMSGARAGTFTAEQWFEKLLNDHLEGAKMLTSGRRTCSDIRLNPEFDRWFMRELAAGNVATLAAIESQKAFETAGVGSLELHTWVAALAAQLCAGGPSPVHHLYAPTLEYGIGYGMAYS
jgi:2,3-dihydroxyphenylpropionate 1,2-dioxygenase